MLFELLRLADRDSLRIVGLMSGTSVDAVDAALVEFTGEARPRLIYHYQHPLPQELRECVLAVSAGHAPPHIGVDAPAAQLAVLDVWLGQVLAAAASGCICQAGVDADLVASHGQTVCHLSRGDAMQGVRTTLQLGCGATLAAATGLAVVNDFRRADMAVGGEGAPLVPFADALLFARPGENVAVQNLGGIGNVTFLPADVVSPVLAFDTGPANMLADAAARKLLGKPFDEGGALAAQGTVRQGLLDRILQHPFLQHQPPRSAGHEEFGEGYFRVLDEHRLANGVSDGDFLATLTAAGPETAVEAYRRYLPAFPDRVILGGGGSLNPVVVQRFRELCAPAPVQTTAELGIPVQAREAMAFAILGRETLLGRTGNVPSATGARGPAVLGALHLPPPSGESRSVRPQ